MRTSHGHKVLATNHGNNASSTPNKDLMNCSSSSSDSFRLELCQLLRCIWYVSNWKCDKNLMTKCPLFNQRFQCVDAHFHMTFSEDERHETHLNVACCHPTEVKEFVNISRAQPSKKEISTLTTRKKPMCDEFTKISSHAATRQRWIESANISQNR